MQQETLLTRAQVEARVGYRRTVIYARMAAGTFPRPVRDPETGSVRWLESEIDGWVAHAVASWPRSGGQVMGTDRQEKKKPLKSAA